jgi:hypothetical protein
MPCAACTYMPNASWRRRGGKAQGEGYLPSEAKRRTSEAEDERSEGLHKRSAEDCGKPLALRQGGALSEAWFPYSCASAHMTFRVALRQEQAPEILSCPSKLSFLFKEAMLQRNLSSSYTGDNIMPSVTDKFVSAIRRRKFRIVEKSQPDDERTKRATLTNAIWATPSERL